MKDHRYYAKALRDCIEQFSCLAAGIEGVESTLAKARAANGNPFVLEFEEVRRLRNGYLALLTLTNTYADRIKRLTDAEYVKMNKERAEAWQ